MKFLPYRFRYWNSYLIFLNIGILTLSFETLDLLPYPFKHWNSCLFLSNINTSSLILFNIGILRLSFCTLQFLPYYFGGARSKGFATLGNVSKLHFFDKIGRAKSVGFRFYWAIWRSESRISSRYLEITSISLIYSLTFSRKKELQSTPDNSNLQGKSKKVRLNGSSSYREFQENSRE